MGKEDLEEYHKQKVMPSPDDVMTEIRDLLFGTRPKSKDVIDKCKQYAESYHQKELKDLEQKVEKLRDHAQVATMDGFKHRDKALREAISLITNTDK